jgi:hypothetical protein
MAITSKSSKAYLQRSGIIPSLPANLPVFHFGANKINDLPLAAPFPLPEFEAISQGDPSPDRGATTEWIAGAP